MFINNPIKNIKPGEAVIGVIRVEMPQVIPVQCFCCAPARVFTVKWVAPLQAAGTALHGGRAEAPLSGQERAEQPERSGGKQRTAGASLEINLAQ